MRKAAPGVSTNNTQRRQDRHSYQDNMALSRQLVGMLACQGTASSRLVSGGRRRQEEARPLGPVGSPTCGQRGLCPGICQVAPGRGLQTGSGMRGGCHLACPQGPALCLLRPRSTGAVPDAAGQRGGRLPLGPRGPVSAPHGYGHGIWGASLLQERGSSAAWQGLGWRGGEQASQALGRWAGGRSCSLGVLGLAREMGQHLCMGQPGGTGSAAGIHLSLKTIGSRFEFRSLPLPGAG